MDSSSVAPLVGAWIEICLQIVYLSFYSVAPLVGAWIEITPFYYFLQPTRSLPSWERGLKYRGYSQKK